jgi:hypothetical protein
MLLSSHQKAGENHDTFIANKSFVNLAQFKCLFGKDSDKSVSFRRKLRGE